MVQGWNLEGNDNGAAVDPNTIFGNAATATALSPSVTTVWTWDKNALKWNFFAPSMTPSALGAYTASKGYGVLATIPQGQGFWVNARNAVSVNLAASQAAATYSISGAVSGATVAGVTLNLTGPTSASTTTDTSGNYSFASLANGSYTITPSFSGYTFSPASNLVTVSGQNSTASNLVATAVPVAIYKLNDTGITSDQCYGAGSDALVACNSAGALALNSAQDGMVGRDVNVAANGNTDGKLGFNFSAVTGGCVQDNVTGLMWEVKTADGGLRDWIKTYTNYDSTTALQKVLKSWDGMFYYGAAPTQAEIDAPTNSVGFRNAVNAQGLCGYSDWRLPTADELQSIVDYGAPPIDATWFPDTTRRSLFWSSSPDVGNSNNAWSVNFADGRADSGTVREGSFYVRLVRAGQSQAQPRYTVSADGQEVTDNQTNLIWRRCAEGMVYGGGTCTGTAGAFTHEAALGRAAAQAGSTGVAWRLPNIKELSSIADKSLVYPAIDSAAFPATPTGVFWSSSPYVLSSNYAWLVVFDYGSVYGNGNGNLRGYSY